MSTLDQARPARPSAVTEIDPELVGWLRRVYDAAA
jgi:hypothetical protein